MTHHHAMVLRMTIFYSFYFIELANISSWPQFSGFLDGDMYHCQLFPHYAFILMQLLSGLNMFASLISDLWIAATECEKSFFYYFFFSFSSSFCFLTVEYCITFCFQLCTHAHGISFFYGQKQGLVMSEIVHLQQVWDILSCPVSFPFYTYAGRWCWETSTKRLLNSKGGYGLYGIPRNSCSLNSCCVSFNTGENCYCMD